MKPGLYQVTTNEPAYQRILDEEAAGRAIIVGERFLPGGVIERVYEVGASRGKENPTIQLGTGFFANALRDYSEWRLKWWRECVQNSIDAGAKNINLTAQPLSDGSWSVSCADDGRGMDERTLFDKFLTLGESGKSERAGQIGGFGKAKELLILPWIQWTVTTRDLSVTGSGVEYNVTRVPRVNGTVLTVVMPADQHTDSLAALEFLQRCNLTGVKISVNGELVTQKLRTGTKTKDLTYGELYHNKSAKYGECYVRANGLYMFTSGGFQRKLGTLIAEVTADTKNVLTANRDGFKSWKLEYEIRDVISEMTVEGERALKKKSGLRTQVWRGTGKVSNDQGMTDVLQVIGPIPAVRPGQALVIEKDQVADIVRAVEEFAQAVPESDLLYNAPVAGRIVTAYTEEPLKGASSVEAFAQQLVWKPDFMVHNEIEGFHVPLKFKPEKMGKGLATLAKLWAEACRWVFIQLNKKGYYGVGFIFSEDTGAAHMQINAENWLLFNPVINGGIPGEVYSKIGRRELKWIYASAVHEVTHMADGYSAHDVSFAYALTRNMAETADGFNTLIKVANALGAGRGVVAEKEERLDESPGEVESSAVQSDLVPVFLKFDRRARRLTLYRVDDQSSSFQTTNAADIERVFKSLERPWTSKQSDILDRDGKIKVRLPEELVEELLPN